MVSTGQTVHRVAVFIISKKQKTGVFFCFVFFGGGEVRHRTSSTKREAP